MTQFEQIDTALDNLDKLVLELKKENEALERKVLELKGVLEDKELEILQLQEDMQKDAKEAQAEKEDIALRLEGVLKRVRAIAPSDKKSQNLLTSV